MRPDIVPQGLLFPAAVEVLERAMQPLHYTELTRLAVEKLALEPGSLAMHKVAEDVREQLLLAGRYETFYLGQPHCLGGLKRWFGGPQESMNFDRFAISPNSWSCALGSFEALMRHPFTLNKKSGRNAFGIEAEERSDVDWRQIREVCWNRASGYVIEYQVSEYIRKRYPTLYLDAENAGKYKKPCSHDFRIQTRNHIITVDVAGRRRDGRYGKPWLKGAADMHLLCSLEERDGVVYVEGWQTGGQFGEWKYPEQCKSPLRFFVWLNCERDGLPYMKLHDAAKAERVAS